MKLLAVDTATEACSAALLIDSEIRQKIEIAPRKHADLILNMVDLLLSEAGITLKQLDGLAFGRGPGAFTGIRIATGIIQGLAYASDLPVIPISNLAALAQSVAGKKRIILSAIDARMKEVYWGVYEPQANGLVLPITDEVVTLPSQVTIPDTSTDDYFGIGTGWRTYADDLTIAINKTVSKIDSEAYPQSKDILTLAIQEYENGNYVDVDSVSPVYLRNKVTG